MKKLVIPLLIIGIVAGSCWFLPTQAQGGDCDLPPEDCAILEAHTAKMLDTTTLTVMNFTFSGSVGLPDPIEFYAEGHAEIGFDAIRATRLLFEFAGAEIDDATKKQTQTILLQRLGLLGYPNAPSEMVDSQIAVEIPLTQPSESFLAALSSSDRVLLEFVDFSEVSPEVDSGDCILTNEQVVRGYLNGLCPPDNAVIGVGGPGSDVPFPTVMTGNEVAEASAVAGNFGTWSISFILTPTGQQILSDFTSQHLGERLAIVLNGIVISAPVIQQPITSGEGQITGNFSETEAKSLAEQLTEKNVLPTKLLLASNTTGSIYLDNLTFDFNVPMFIFGTQASPIRDQIRVGLSDGIVTITGSTADSTISFTPVEVSTFFLHLALANTQMGRLTDAVLNDPVAVFESEVSLQTLLHDPVIADPLARFLILVFFGDIDFEDYELTRSEANEFLANTLQVFPSKESLLVRRYISLDDYSLRRVELSTDFEFPVSLLADTLGIPLFEDANETSIIHFELQADFDE